MTEPTPKPDASDEPGSPEPPRRPSGAPEIPEVLRQRPKPAAPAESDKSQGVSSLAAGFALGTDMMVSIAAFLGLGYLADRWLGTSPWFLMAGLAAGMATAIIRMLQWQKRTQR